MFRDVTIATCQKTTEFAVTRHFQNILMINVLLFLFVTSQGEKSLRSAVIRRHICVSQLPGGDSRMRLPLFLLIVQLMRNLLPMNTCYASAWATLKLNQVTPGPLTNNDVTIADVGVVKRNSAR